MTGPGEGRRCVVMNETPVNPRDIFSLETNFGQLARWSFYGRRAAYHVQRDPTTTIPRITHYVRVTEGGLFGMYKPEDLAFQHYISKYMSSSVTYRASELDL